jgi:GGDEF domain-containing protein
MKSLFTPAVLIVLVAIALHTGWAVPSAALITFALYAALIAGFLMAWRFHSSRIFLALLVLFLSERAISYFSNFSVGHGASNSPVITAVVCVGILLPVDFALISLAQEKGFTFSSLAPSSLLLFIQSVIVAVLCRPEPRAGASHFHHPAAAIHLPLAVLLTFTTAAGIILIRFLLFRKPLESGLLWGLVASLLALRFGGAGRIPSAYFATAAIILAVSMVETSYLLAYHDELTSLPSRRAFHEALLRLEPPYSIAMVDIDHFKRCNDTYGHDTGDQVLRLVASRLARVTGGGQAYRCGGEEFAIVFPGKTTKDVLDHLEDLRMRIESSSFRLRGQDRRQEPRGPDRRNQRGSVRTHGQAIRQLSRVSSPGELSVTASIGVATSTQLNASPDEVVKAADKALYSAKDAGRNRVEAASPSRKRAARSKAAGIA